MSNTQYTKFNIDPKGEKTPRPVQVRMAKIARARMDATNSHNAKLMQDEAAPNHSGELFESQYKNWLARLDVLSPNHKVTTVAKAKKAEEAEKEYKVPEELSDHKVTSKAFKRLDLDDQEEEAAADTLALDAMVDDTTRELSEIEPVTPEVKQPIKPEDNAQPNNVIDLDKERQKQRDLEQIRMNISNQAKSGSEILDKEKDFDDFRQIAS